MGDRPPDYKALRTWFTYGQPSMPDGDLPFDIMAIGTQECSYKPRVGFESCEKDWASAVSEALGPRFDLVSASSLRDSIRLLLFVRKRWVNRVHSVHSASYSTTIPMFWRKGGIGVQMSFINTTFCFIAVHLAAHDTETMNRNMDIAAILKTLNLGNPNYDVGHQFHHCFFIGDMNYRVSLKDRAIVDEHLQRHKYDELLRHDQLRTEQATGQILYDFVEAPITFAPTFKVKRGTRDLFDVRRTPSWCDRVLVHSLPGCQIRALSYVAVDPLLSSDHVPVAGAFEVAIPVVKVSYRDEEALRQFLTSTSRYTSPFQTASPPITPSPHIGHQSNLLAVSQQVPVRPSSAPFASIRTSTSVGSHLDDLTLQQPDFKHYQQPQTIGYRSVTPCTFTTAITMDQLTASTEIVNSDASLFEINLSNVTVRLTPLTSNPALMKQSQWLTQLGNQEPTPRIVLSSPILHIEPIKSDPLFSAQAPFVWDSIPPALTKPITKVALGHHHLFIAVYHYISSSSETLIAHAVLQLKDFIEPASPLPFDLPLIYCGVHRGTISGTLIVQ